MPRPGVVAVPVLALGLSMPARVFSQSAVSAQAGIGTVRFAGGSTTGVLSLSPDYSYAGQNLQLSLAATAASVPRSGGYGQLRLGTWITTAPLSGLWRLATDLELTGTTVGGGVGSGFGSVTGEVLYATPRWGGAIGAGPTSGWITGSRPVTALHTRVRAWWNDAPSGTTLTATIEPNRLLGAWYSDITSAFLLRRSRWTTQITATGRISSSYVSRSAALVSIEYRFSPSWSINVVGGNVLPDPYQGFPAAGVVFAGVRLHLPLHRALERPVVRSSGFTVRRSADGVTLELERRGAQSVSIAGDWNSWLATPLNTTRPDHWVVHLALPPGVYHFTLLIDGSTWTIPSGVPSVPDGMGGQVAVLVVTP
ncbi:MAG TPA: glycogen-binding domain-containing protein [Gemmatimonadales bacterium]